MRRYLQYIISSVSVLSLLFVTTSCEHKDLCYHHPHGVKLKVEFDWSKAPEAFAKGMCIYFYPEDGGSYRRFDFSNKQGGYIELTEGTYNVICYNNDTECVMFSGVEDFYSHNLFTRNGDLFEPRNSRTTGNVLRAEGSESERVVITPDMMWGCAVTKVYVAETGVTYTHETITGDMDSPQLKVENTTEDFILTFYPEDLLCHYSYKIINVVNLKNVQQMCASLSGMSGSLKLNSQELSRECVTLPFVAIACKTDSTTIEGEFYTFGHHLENQSPHKMVLYVWYSEKDFETYPHNAEITEADRSNEGLEDRFDVTTQIHNAENKRRVKIIIDGLRLKDKIDSESGYTPSVDDWNNIYEDIFM